MIGPQRVIAHMRVAMDHAIAIKGGVPREEHIQGDRIARLKIEGFGRHEGRAVEPAHGQQSVGAEIVHRLGDMHIRFVRQHMAIEPHVFGFAVVIQFFAQAGR